MKEKDVTINNAQISVENTFQQAQGYYEDCVQLMGLSKYDFFNPDEELTLEEAQDKYNEKNRRLQTLGQAFELYFKYILLAHNLEKNPDISSNELWGKWIRGHKFKDLFLKATTGEHKIDNFSIALIHTINSFLHFHYDGETKYFYFNHKFKKYNDYYKSVGDDCPDNLIIMQELCPDSFYPCPDEFGPTWLEFEEKHLNQILDYNNALYEKCRYSMESTTDFDFAENFHYISAIKFFATMIYNNNGKIPENLNVVYLKTKMLDENLMNIIHKIRNDSEIKEIFNLEIISDHAFIIALLLSDNFYSIDDLKQLLKLMDFTNNEVKLHSILSNKISLDKMKFCLSEQIPIERIDLYNYPLEVYERIFSIKNVGNYMKENPEQLDIICKLNSIGIEIEDCIKILSMNELVEYVELLPNLFEYIRRNINHFRSDKNQLCMPFEYKHNITWVEILEEQKQSSYEQTLILKRIIKEKIEEYSNKGVGDCSNSFQKKIKHI